MLNLDLDTLLSLYARRDQLPRQAVGLSPEDSTSTVQPQARTVEEQSVRVNPTALRVNPTTCVIQPSQLPSAATHATEVNSAAFMSQMTTVQPLQPPPYLSNEEYSKLTRAERNRLKAQRTRHAKLSGTVSRRGRNATRQTYSTLPHTITSSPVSDLRTLLTDKRVGLDKVDGGTFVTRDTPGGVLPQNVHNISTDSIIFVAQTRVGSRVGSFVSQTHGGSDSLINVSSFSELSAIQQPENLPQSTIPSIAPITSTIIPIQTDAPLSEHFPPNTSQASPNIIQASPNIIQPSPTNAEQPSPAIIVPPSPVSTELFEDSQQSPIPILPIPTLITPELITATSANCRQFYETCVSYVEGNSPADSLQQQVTSLKECNDKILEEQEQVLLFLNTVIRPPPDDRVLALQRRRKDIHLRLRSLMDEMIDFRKSFPPE